MRRLGIVPLAIAMALIVASPARADGPDTNTTKKVEANGNQVTAESRRTENGPPNRNQDSQPSNDHRGNPDQRANTGGRKVTDSAKADRNALERAALERQRKIAAAVQSYENALAAQRNCLAQNTPVTRTGAASDFCSSPTPPDFGSGNVLLDGTVQGEDADPVPILTAEQVAYMAIARLTLPTIAPGIGPDPSLNQWDIAVVGYPYWLWADGPTTVGPVSDSIGGLSVSLQGRVTRMTFRMGDGHTVNCSGSGQKWTPAVKGKPSPSCGHTYQKPSKSQDYTITATSYWAVTWTINGQSGTIEMPQSTSMRLPVGELQVLIR